MASFFPLSLVGASFVEHQVYYPYLFPNYGLLRVLLRVPKVGRAFEILVADTNIEVAVV